jgi:hypothetical protein
LGFTSIGFLSNGGGLGLSVKKKGLTRDFTHHSDCDEGVQSFFQKREPKFTATLEEGAPPNFPWWKDVDTGKRPRAATGSKAKL